jgi:hypothetical protein
MKSVWLLLLLSLGCQRGDTSSEAAPRPVAAPAGDYAQDVAALCDCVSRSGADKVEEDARALTIANWLSANLKTPESRKFLVEIQPLVGEAKANRLDAEAKRVGLPGCALAAEWRKPPVN